MDVIIQHAEALHGTLTVPPDKAICHRATILCALANKPTLITPWSSADDCQRTLAIVEQLGVPVTRTVEGIRINGVGLNGLKQPTNELDCGDSGTTMRLSCGLLAGQPFNSRLTCGESLRHRPMRRVIEPLSRMGARIEAISPVKGMEPEDYPPLDITGSRLTGIAYTLPVASAQVKSAILLAGLYADRPTTVIEPLSTRDHTERLLQKLGVKMIHEGTSITLHPPTGKLPGVGQLTVPGDPSSAAFFIVAATIVPGSRVILHHVGLNPTRIGFLRVLERMGLRLYIEMQEEGWEPRGTLTVESARLHGTTVTAKEVPLLIDEVPILVVAACVAEGQTRFEGVGELRVKETDRLHSMVTGLKAMGANLLASPDGSLVVQGGRPLHHATVESFGDHRTAMSLAVAGLVAQGTTTVKGAECVAKSFPEFFEQLRLLAADGTDGKNR